jgi:hypothetical protein
LDRGGAMLPWRVWCGHEGFSVAGFLLSFWVCFVLFCFLVALGFELTASSLPGRHLPLEPLCQPYGVPSETTTLPGSFTD